LVVSKQATQKFDGKRFNLKELNELEVRKQYQIKITNRFAALENSSVGKDINRGRENMKDSIKTTAKGGLGMHELKEHTPWFCEECLVFFKSNKAG